MCIYTSRSWNAKLHWIYHCQIASFANVYICLKWLVCITIGHIYTPLTLKGLLKHIQAYSEPCVTLAYSQPCHIPSPGIFKTDGKFKTLRNFDQAYSDIFLPIVRTAYLDIFRTLYNSCICRNLSCSEPCHIYENR